jgi:enoyl-CoA hydratase/carnithine racemase
MTALISLARRNGVAVISYANPPMGFMTAAGVQEWRAAFDQAVADPEARAIVLTGSQAGVFVRHYDVAEIVRAGEAVRGGAIGAEAFDHAPFADFTDAIAAAPKPVIAAINGVCMGGGFEIALACDLRIAHVDCDAIGLPEVRLGIFPGGGGTQRLPRLIGEAAALAFIIQGAVVGARRALELGLVSELSNDPVAKAAEIAAGMARFGAEGVAAAKRLVRASLDRPLAEALIDERRSFAEVLKTSDAAMEAMRRFVDTGADIRRP